jgi:glutamine amidotransferase
MITIVDYGMGNLRSVHKAFEHLGFRAEVTADPRKVEDAQRLVLPGVGAFGDCIANLRAQGFVEAIHSHIESGRPFLGICLGLQVLFDKSEEFGTHAGLGIIPGTVERFAEDMHEQGEALKIPHMGWNQIEIERDCPLLHGVENGSYVYFVHSYHVVPARREEILTTTEYGIRFCSAIWRDNVMATQFHPEKSQAVGLKILKNFGEM